MYFCTVTVNSEVVTCKWNSIPFAAKLQRKRRRRRRRGRRGRRRRMRRTGTRTGKISYSN